jgi:protein O-mannosyl-transferase
MDTLPDQHRSDSVRSLGLPPGRGGRSFLIICLALALVTVLCYSDLPRHAFINHDDQEYITQNPKVTAGLSWAGTVWAFTTGHASNWHPVTWLSHMLDCQVYGLNPTGHHLTNLGWHSANVVLLFLLLESLTGARWRSAFVAALFAVHPLHVESVAWASERKDVLSTLFFLLTLLAYAKYVRERARVGGTRVGREAFVIGASPHQRVNSTFYYACALIFFALGLMSKPMVVTLPCVLLLLDYWPLQRFELSKKSVRSLLPLLSEKVPFFMLAFAASVVTYWVQKSWGATYALDRIPLAMRCENAVMAYVRYLGKAFWPTHLAVFYPYQEHWPMREVIAATVLLVLVTLLIVVSCRQHRFLVVGWLWFLGTLVPTIGLVQVGSQSMADRYMYIPSIGLFVLVVWAISLTGRRAINTSTWGRAIAWGSLGVLCACTMVQNRYWRNDETLFRHALEVTDDNYFAYVHLADASAHAGRREEALRFCLEAVRVRPQFAEGHYNAGTYLLDMGRLEEGVKHLRQALAANPRLAPAHLNLGKALVSLGQSEEANREIAEAVALAPENPDAHYGLGTLLLRTAKPAEAEAEFREALRWNLDRPEFHMNLAIALIQQGKRPEALAHFAETARLAPANPEAHFNYGVGLLEDGRLAEALSQFSEVLRLKPDTAKAHYQMAAALVRCGKREEAIQHYREVLRLAPAFPGAAEALARLQAAEVVQRYPDS